MDLNVKYKTIKLWEENIQDQRLGEEFLDMKWKAQSIKEKSNILNLTKIKHLCSVNNHVRMMKIQATELEEIYEDHVSDKELISRIYKNSTVKKQKSN